MTFNLIDKLYKNNIIERGDFTLKSGLKSDIYFDVRKAMSYPKLLEQIGNAIFAKIDAKYKGDYDNIVICGVPYGAVPISMQIGISKSISMIMKRKEIKEHGNKNLIEGVYKKGDKCIVIEDVVTTGKSMLETVKELESCGLIIDHIISFIDRRRSAHLLYEEDGYDYSYILDMNMINEYENNRNLRQRLKNIVKEKESNICFSADLINKSQLLEIVSKVAPFICAIKIHSDIIINFDNEFINKLKILAKLGNFLIIEDRKLSDIGNTMINQLNTISWADIVTVHGISGEKSIVAMRDTCIKNNIFLLLVAEMSCEGNLIKKDYSDSVVSIAKNNKDFILGLVSHNKLDCDSDLMYFTPGICLNRNNDSYGQNYRNPSAVNTDIYIIGRSIYEANNPEDMAIRYKNHK